MSTYFGSGQDRSSNDWQKACDLILIVGTPRVAPQVVAEHLARTRHLQAACIESEWCAVHWEAETESGQRIVVRDAAIAIRSGGRRTGHSFVRR